MTEMNVRDTDRLELVLSIGSPSASPASYLDQHEVRWQALDDGHEALLVDGGGIDGGDGVYFANAGDDVHAGRGRLRSSTATSAAS